MGTVTLLPAWNNFDVIKDLEQLNPVMFPLQVFNYQADRSA